jgi:sporadic carbohydrate cluster protein (TIGR04323 family)
MKVRGYIYSRTFQDERVPQHVQNLVIRDFCNKNNLQYLLSSSEYVMDGSSMMLQQIINEIKNIDGIVAYSVFQLPEDDKERNDYLNEILEHKKIIFFAVEGLKVFDDKTKTNIEEIWKISKILKFCIKGVN